VKPLLVWLSTTKVDVWGDPLGPWELGPRPVPDSEHWYRTGKTRYSREALAAARSMGWRGSVMRTPKGEVLSGEITITMSEPARDPPPWLPPLLTEPWIRED
jgi:hypothetical protein